MGARCRAAGVGAARAQGRMSGGGFMLDTGALIAIDRGTRRMLALLEAARDADLPISVTAPVVGQAWRDGRRQARLAAFLKQPSIDVAPFAATLCHGRPKGKRPIGWVRPLRKCSGGNLDDSRQKTYVGRERMRKKSENRQMADSKSDFNYASRAMAAIVQSPRSRFLAATALVVLLVGVRAMQSSKTDSVSLAAVTEDEESDLPIHLRADYNIEPPDILTIEVTADGVDHELLTSIDDRYLVSPDGKVDLGDYLGKVFVAGLTPSAVAIAIEARLKAKLPSADNIKCRVAVADGNSRVYYVIAENRRGGDQVYRLPISVHDTVRRTLVELTNLPNLGSKNLWIARPKVEGGVGRDEILRIDWRSVSVDPTAKTNHAVLPGDRIFIHEPPGIWDLLNAVIAGFSNPDAPPL